ncbi:MAG TPA: efflux RND transporter periplasmic adaptor subunit [Terriglobia bacterium]|nr:efflux RND transporter periplasmic adaptor subunit [Terriglobia bacterium]
MSFRKGLVLFIAIILLSSCSNKVAQAGRATAPAAPVSVADAVVKYVPVEIPAVGNAEAYSTVGIKAQVGGQLISVNFQEGADVKKGDLLFMIDPRPYESQVAQYQATLAKDKAQLPLLQANLDRDIAQEQYATAQARRYTDLTQRGLVPKESSDQTNAQATAAREAIKADRAAIESAKANLAADEATLQNAKLLLEYCTIRSPIDGRTGHIMVRQGNIVKASDVDLVTINQLRPIFVTFAVPEDSLPLIKKHMASGSVPVQAYAGTDTTPEVGKLTFVENSVDSTTGTIRLKALFDNTAVKLWPGEFLRTVVQLNETQNSVVIPSAAVQTSQDGKFVFVVKSDMTVESRPVTVGRVVDREIVIEKGLSGGETVVTEGQLRLGPGSRVQIKSKGSDRSSLELRGRGVRGVRPLVPVVLGTRGLTPLTPSTPSKRAL